MQAQTAAWLDWRDGSAYAPLLGADRSLFAWEWLRRDARYRAAAGRALVGGGHPRGERCAADFGLVAFEPPDLRVPDARPLWNARAHPYVLRAAPAPPDAPEDSVAPGLLRPHARIVEDGGTAYLLLSDGLRAIRLDAPAGAFECAQLRLTYTLEGFASAEAPLLTLRRFLALCRNGRFSRSLHGHEPRARRWILMLRAHDALAAGVSQRDIARELLSSSVSGARWRTREPSIRSQVQRLVRAAAWYSDAGYRALLR